MSENYTRLRGSDLATVREEIRAGRYASHTAGLGAGYLQTNLAILPARHALDFMRYCQRNPKPCPLVGVSDTGNPMMFTLGEDIDIRTDVPAYNVYRDGRLSESVTDIRALWTDDMVAFALGCSFTFEEAMRRAGIPIWHIENDRTVMELDIDAIYPSRVKSLYSTIIEFISRAQTEIPPEFANSKNGP